MECQNKPILLYDLIELIGFDKTRLLLYSRAGQKVYIPMAENLTEDHWLVKTLGLEDAVTICNRYQRLQIVLPLGLESLCYRSRGLVEELLAQGSSYNQIVKASGVSYRTISRRRKDLNKEKPKAPSLFDHMKKS